MQYHSEKFEATRRQEATTNMNLILVNTVMNNVKQMVWKWPKCREAAGKRQGGVAGNTGNIGGI